MNKDKLRLFRSTKLSVILVVAVALLITLVIIIIANIDSIKNILSGTNHGLDGEFGGENGLPIISDTGALGEGEIFYESNTSDIFSTINVRDSYRREFRITNSYSGTQTTETFILLKSGSDYSVESSSKKMTYSNGKLYIESELYTLTTDATISELYEDIGITSLERVIEIAGSENAQVAVSDDGKKIIIYYTDPDYSRRSEYEISVESGIVTYEAHYLNGQLTRSVVTDFVDVLVGQEIPKEQFTIPTLQ